MGRKQNDNKIRLRPIRESMHITEDLLFWIDGFQSMVSLIVMAEHHSREGTGSGTKVHEFPVSTRSTAPRIVALELLALFLDSSRRTTVFFEYETKRGRFTSQDAGRSCINIYWCP